MTIPIQLSHACQYRTKVTAGDHHKPVVRQVALGCTRRDVRSRHRCTDYKRLGLDHERQQPLKARSDFIGPRWTLWQATIVNPAQV
jgi:hypothetical protein